MTRRVAVTVFAGFLLVADRGVARAQSVASATISGVVYDPAGAVVQGAHVILRNVATNARSEATTNGRGEYRLVYVQGGEYRLSAESTGFTPSGVDLAVSVGQEIDVPLRLVAGASTDAIQVNGESPLVDAARTGISGTVGPKDIERLPLNGRNYLDLALLVPNVSRTNTRANDRFAETSAVPGTGLSIAGQRNLGNTFLVDGLSANDDAADLAGTYYGEEVIREFQVITSGGSAEFGRASTGVVNIVTQSGTNQYRGRAYGFFRNDALDARNALATGKDPLHQSQYGFSLGGPIARDRTFWFGNVERTDQSKAGVVTISDANVTAINAALDQFAYAGPRIATGSFTTGYDTTNVFARVDHAFSDSTRLQVHYNFYDVSSPNARGVGGLNDVSRGTALDDTDHTLVLSLLSTVSPAVLNELRAQYISSSLAAPTNDPIGPAVTVSGAASLGTSTSSPTGRDLDVFEVADTLTLQRGAHLLKAGADALFNRVDITFPGALQGSYTFSSVANLQRGVYVQFQQAFGRPSLAQSNPNLGLFVQDEWRVARALTLNAGMRYDLQWLPDPITLDANNVSPRAGLAWAPGNGATVVRASGGLYFDRIPLRATSNALQRDGVNYKVAVLSPGQAGAPRFPNVSEAFPPNVVSAVTSIDTDIQNGRTGQFGVEVERGIGHCAAASVGYSYLRGTGILMSRNINAPTLTAAQALALGIPNLGRPNPAFGNISQYQAIGDSWFEGLTVSLNTRNAPWGGIRASYTLSNAQDTAGNAFFNAPQNNNDIAAEKGPADNDQRHRLVVSGTLGGTRASTVGRWLAGVQVGYVAAFATGVPFNVVTGNDRNNDTTVNDRPVGVGRNSERLPAGTTFDLRVSRAFALAGSQRIELLAEAFNLFNHVNVLNVNNTYGTGLTPLPAFGQPILAGDPRQIQLGVRWTF